MVQTEQHVRCANQTNTSMRIILVLCVPLLLLTANLALPTLHAPCVSLLLLWSMRPVVVVFLGSTKPVGNAIAAGVLSLTVRVV